MQRYVLTELDSGERVISERLSHVRSVAIGFWIGAGSRDETDAKAGVSHFLEHLLFKGTASYSAQEIAEIFDALGGELNAATSREHTVVYARVPDEHVAVQLALARLHGLREQPARVIEVGGAIASRGEVRVEVIAPVG